MTTVRSLYDNKWVSLNEVELDNGAKFVYATEPWCDSLGVALLIYRTINGVKEYLGRYEICPSHGTEPQLCSFTGGVDKRVSPQEIAVMEAKEEAGYKINVADLQFLGGVLPSKASDKSVILFAVDVTGLEQGVAIGDGTLGEEGSYTKWVTEREAIFCKDPLVATMITRLNYE